MSVISEIHEIIESGEYACYATRVASDHVIIGQTMPASRRWYDGSPVNSYRWVAEGDVREFERMGYERMTNEDAELMQANGYWGEGGVLMVNWNEYELLDGTCGVNINGRTIEKSIEVSNKYNGDYIMLIAGDNFEEGNDTREVVIENATVLGVWQKQ